MPKQHSQMGPHLECCLGVTRPARQTFCTLGFSDPKLTEFNAENDETDGALAYVTSNMKQTQSLF